MSPDRSPDHEAVAQAELPSLLRVDQTADCYQLGRTKMYELRRGPLRPAVIRVGRAIRIRRDVLEQLIEEGRDLR